MNIAFDGKRAVSNMTGLGNYSRRVVGALARHYPQHRYLLLAPKLRHSPELDALLAHENVSITTARHAALGHIWRSGCGIINAAKDHGCSLFHGLSAELPIGIARSGMASVVTIHDLIFHHYPQHYKAIDRWIYDRKIAYACRHATRLVAVSQSTKRDVVEAFQVSADKIDVVYPSVDELYLNPVSEACGQELRQLLQVDGRYVLTVGRLVYHKNLLAVIQALSLMRDKQVSMVLVGRENAYWRSTLYPTLQRLHLTDRVTLIPWVESRLMPALYACASVMVFPSLYEGFGAPVLEAQQCGTPVVCARGSSLDEAGGDGAIFFDPHDAAQLAEEVDHVLGDESYARQLAERGRAHARQFLPRAMTERLWECYQRALADRGMDGR